MNITQHHFHRQETDVHKKQQQHLKTRHRKYSRESQELSSVSFMFKVCSEAVTWIISVQLDHLETLIIKLWNCLVPVLIRV